MSFNMSTVIVPYTVATVDSLSSVHGSSERSFSNESTDIRPIPLPVIPSSAFLDQREANTEYAYESEISSSQSAPALLSTSMINMKETKDEPCHVRNLENNMNEMSSSTNGLPIVINYPAEHDDDEMAHSVDGSALSFCGYGMVGFIAGLGLSLFSLFGVRFAGCQQASKKQQVAFFIGAVLGAVANIALVVLYFTTLNPGGAV